VNSPRNADNAHVLALFEAKNELDEFDAFIDREIVRQSRGRLEKKCDISHYSNKYGISKYFLGQANS
jgi:hypothetical protein